MYSFAWSIQDFQDNLRNDPQISVLQPQGDIDVGLLLKLQNKVKILERERELLRKKIEESEDEVPRTRGPGITNESAFDALKVR